MSRLIHFMSVLPRPILTLYAPNYENINISSQNFFHLHSKGTLEDTYNNNRKFLNS